MAYLRSSTAVLGLDGADLDALELAARYTSPNGVTHLTWQQTSHGVPSYDGLLTVNVAADGNVRTGEYSTNNTARGIRKNAIDCAVGSANTTSCPGNATVGAGGWTVDDTGHIGSYATTAAGDRYSRFQVHDEGELWSETLWDLRTAIGATAARGLVTEAMRLPPSGPSFFDERDAILQATSSPVGRTTAGSGRSSRHAAWATARASRAATRPVPRPRSTCRRLRSPSRSRPR